MEQTDSQQKTSRQKFTHEEDQRLVELVAIHGTHAWKKIAQIMKTRTTRQCRERYINYLSPNLTNGPWSPQEDAFLIQKVKEMGPRWSKIVKFFPTRSDVNIKNRYALFVSKGKAPALKSHPREPAAKKTPVPEAQTNNQCKRKSAEVKPEKVNDDKYFDELIGNLSSDSDFPFTNGMSEIDPLVSNWDLTDFNLF